MITQIPSLKKTWSYWRIRGKLHCMPHKKNYHFLIRATEIADAPNHASHLHIFIFIFQPYISSPAWILNYHFHICQWKKHKQDIQDKLVKMSFTFQCQITYLFFFWFHFTFFLCFSFLYGFRYSTAKAQGCRWSLHFLQQEYITLSTNHLPLYSQQNPFQMMRWKVILFPSDWYLNSY